jgi:hypothetical protein
MDVVDVVDRADAAEAEDAVDGGGRAMDIGIGCVVRA